MDIKDIVKKKLSSPKFLEQRAQRREARLAKFLPYLHDAVEAVSTNGGEFSRRQALMWGQKQDTYMKKIEGNTADEASMFATEVFGEFNIPGTFRCRYLGMNRTSGHGGHGITEGTITVEATLKPIHGMTETVEIPIQVRKGYMLAPSLMYYKGSACLIAQSAIDKIMDYSKYRDKMDLDRNHLYSTEIRNAARREKERTFSEEELSGKKYDPFANNKAEVMDTLSPPRKKAPSQPAGAPAKRKREQPREFDETELSKTSQIDYDNEPDFLKNQRHTNKQKREEVEHLLDRGTRFDDELEDVRDALKNKELEEHDNMAGKSARLACAMEVGGSLLKAGAKVFVISASADEAHIRDADGVEAIVGLDYLV
jgi:hypothetical protein